MQRPLDHSLLRSRLFFNDNRSPLPEPANKEAKTVVSSTTETGDGTGESSTTPKPQRRRVHFRPDVVAERRQSFPSSLFSELFASLDGRPDHNAGEKEPPKSRTRKPAAGSSSEDWEEDFPEVLGRVANIYGKLFHFIMDESTGNNHHQNVVRPRSAMVVVDHNMDYTR